METGTHPHLLIIEDDVLLNDMTKRLLTQHGYCVTSAYSGSEALLLIEKGTFDLILLDLMLPGIPGETVLEKMKSTMDIPIIGVSAKTDIDSKVNLIRNGADDYITKPFSLAVLRARVANQLRRFWCGLKQCSGAFRSLPPPTIAKYFALRTCPLIQKLWRLKSGIPPLL